MSYFKILSDAAIKAPHRILKNPQGGTRTHLEVSFARHSIEEIEQWEKLGVVQEALEGRAKSRRNYQKTLMDHFAGRRHQGVFFSKKKFDDRKRVMEMLWEGGAKDHEDRFAVWLCGAIVYPLGDLLLDRKVNPFTSITHENMSKSTSAFGSLLDSLHDLLGNRDLAKEGSWPHFMQQELSRKIETCISREMSPKEFELALSEVERLAMSSGSSNEDQIWASWRDRLLEKGFAPNLESGAVICNKIFHSDLYFGKSRVSEEDEKALQDSLEKGASVEDVEKMRHSINHDHFTKIKIEWLNAILKGVEGHRGSKIKLSNYFWSSLMHMSEGNGYKVGKELLENGYHAPWHTPDCKGSEYFLSPWGNRVPVKLESFLMMTSTTNVNSNWMENQVALYLHIRPGGDPPTLEDFALCAQGIEHAKGSSKVLEEAVIAVSKSYFKPDQLVKSSGVFNFAQTKGWIEKITNRPIQLSPGANSTFAHNISQNQEMFTAAEAMDNGAYARNLRVQAAVSNMFHEDWSVAEYWIDKAVEIDPSASEIIEHNAALFFDTQSKSSQPSQNLINKIISISPSGGIHMASAIIAKEKETYWAGVRGKNLERHIEFAKQIIEAGADLSSLPVIENPDDLPTTRLFAIEQQRHLMRNAAASHSVSSGRSRRL